VQAKESKSATNLIFRGKKTNHRRVTQQVRSKSLTEKSITNKRGERKVKLVQSHKVYIGGGGTVLSVVQVGESHQEERREGLLGVWGSCLHYFPKKRRGGFTKNTIDLRRGDFPSDGREALKESAGGNNRR